MKNKLMMFFLFQFCIYLFCSNISSLACFIKILFAGDDTLPNMFKVVTRSQNLT